MPVATMRFLTVLLLCTAAVACEDTATITPPVTEPISSGTWYLNAANDSTLPARISDRFIGIVFEEVFVDSSRLEIDVATLTWRQRYWLRVNHNGVLDRADYIQDEGAFAAAGASYQFTSTIRNRAFSVVVTLATELETTEPMAFHSGAPLVNGVYRPTPP